jgi:hypothetical protein
MKNIEINIKCVGNPVEAIGEALSISKAIKGTVWIDFTDFKISVSQESIVLDLYEIYTLNHKLISKK